MMMIDSNQNDSGFGDSSPNDESHSELDPGAVRAFLDGELSSADEGDVVARLELDPTMSEEISRLQVETSECLSLLDAEFDGSEFRVRQARAELRRRVKPARPGGRRWVGLARAAAIAAVFIGAGATGILGSPLQRWIQAGWEGLGLGGGVAQEDPNASSEATMLASGVQIQPLRGSVQIRLTDVSSSTELLVRIVQDTQGWVYAPDGSDYEVAPGLVEVSVVGDGTEIEIPEELAEAFVEVNGTAYLIKRGADLEFLGPPPEVTDGEFRFRVP